MAERAAWEFMQHQQPNFDLVVINPSLVMGPSHASTINTSNQILIDLINGKYPFIMALAWGLVDVRDVADAHVAAMEIPEASGRYICAGETLSMAAVVDLMQSLGYEHTKLPKLKFTGRAGTWLMRLLSHTQPTGVGCYLRTHLGRVPRFDNKKIKREIGISFRKSADTIRHTLADLAKWRPIAAGNTS